jgi:hypothetical protein
MVNHLARVETNIWKNLGTKPKGLNEEFVCWSEMNESGQKEKIEINFPKRMQNALDGKMIPEESSFLKA